MCLMPKWCKYLTQFFCILLFAVCNMASYGQIGSDETFGKKRVQFHDDFKYWWLYESPNFVTYWYDKARKPAESTILIAEEEFNNIQSLLDHRLNTKTEIILYKDISDFNQSNLGQEEIFTSNRYDTKVDGNKMYLYFDGDHESLRKQLRSGIARVHIQNMMQTTYLRDLVNSALSNHVPKWYIDGLVSYLRDPYDIELDNELRLLLSQHKIKKFKKLVNKNERLAGYAFWKYIADRHGEKTISNLLYITRLNNRIQSGFKYVLNTTFENEIMACFEYIISNYNQDAENFAVIREDNLKVKKKNRNDVKITQLALHPTKDELVYVQNEIGQYHVYVKDLNSGKSKKLLKGSNRNPFQPSDLFQPIFKWNATGTKLYGIYEKRDVLYLREYDSNWAFTDDEMAPKYQRIIDFDVYGKDTLILSAVADAYVDLFFYYPKRRESSRLTNDYYDEGRLTVNDDQKIIFESNRKPGIVEKKKLEVVVPEADMDLYEFDVKTKRATKLLATEYAKEERPIVNGKELYCISDFGGIKNIHSVQVGGHIGLTNYVSNVTTFSVNQHHIAYAVAGEKRDELFVVDKTSLVPLNIAPTKTYQSKTSEMRASGVLETEIVPEEINDSLFFQTKYKTEIPLPETMKRSQPNEERPPIFIFDEVSELKVGEAQKFNPARMLAYRKRFGFTDMGITVNNDNLFGELNTFAGFGEGFEFPPMGILAHAESRDVLENFVISGGGRIPLAFNGSEFYLAAENRTKRLDKKLAFYRKSMKEKNDLRIDSSTTRNTIHMGVFKLTYPFSIFQHVSLITTLRQDRIAFIPEEANALNKEDRLEQRIGLRLEYVFDNTYEKSKNILNGFRAKLYVEAVNRFEWKISPWKLDPSTKQMLIVGFDARKYIRLDKYAIFAARFAGATTIGSERIIYYLGGTRNWLNKEYNNQTPLPNNINFAYEAPAVSMRGFDQNVRNGASYLLTNMELRVPVLHYFLNKPIRSNFARNLQLVGFLDVGTAWHGTSPYSDDNSLNNVTVSNPTVISRVTYYRDPIVVGAGAGLRVQLFGYFFRLDYAVGLETRVWNKPRIMISFGEDF